MGRNEDSSGPQPFLDLIAETVRVAEDTIVVENAAVQVSIQKSIERREPLLILYGERIERDASFPAGCLKAGLAFVGLAGNSRTQTQKEQLLTAQFQQFLGGRRPAARRQSYRKRHRAHRF